MKQQTLGTMISSIRKDKKMTQLDLAEKMNVTDKAVSKWERDISCPDINSLPRLAEVLGVSVDELMQCKSREDNSAKNRVMQMVDLILRVLPLAMGVAVVVLSILKALDTASAIALLGIGLACAGLSLLNQKSANSQ